MDESLDDCAFSLDLVVGNDYVISLVGSNASTGACDTFVATILAAAGSIFSIDDGAAIELGSVTVNGDGTATFSGSFESLLSCPELGFEDQDADGACDGWDGSLPNDEGDLSSTACTADEQCADGEYCEESLGYCFSDSFSACATDADCEAQFPGAGRTCSAEHNTCVEGSGGGTGDDGGDAVPTLADFAGTYEISSASNCANNATVTSNAVRYEAASLSGDQLILTGSNEPAESRCGHGATAIAPAGSNGVFSATNVVTASESCPGCPLDEGLASDYEFYVESGQKLLVRTVLIGAGTWLAPAGCTVIYVMQ